MTKFLITLVTVISLFALVNPDVEARRMGGSKSFGKQSSNVTKQKAPAQPAGANQAQPATPGTAAPAAPGAAAAKPASPWKGMLGGALLGLGLGALLSSMGLGAGMANIISILLMAGIGIALVMLVMRLFNRQQAQKSGSALTMKNAYAGPAADPTGYTTTPEIGSRITGSGRHEHSESSDVSEGTWEIPAGFDVAQFERTAQTYFIRLQAAWDKADINDIREFTTPEMYAEIKLQIQERGAISSVTDVITIHAKLLGIETQESAYLASVRFVGTMKEEADGPTVSFEEIWNLSKPVAGQGGWVLAGIQQVEQLG